MGKLNEKTERILTKVQGNRRTKSGLENSKEDSGNDQASKVKTSGLQAIRY